MMGVESSAQERIDNRTARFTKISVQGDIDIKLKKADSAAFEIEITNGTDKSFDWDVIEGVFTAKLKQAISLSNKTAKASATMIIYYTSLEEIKADICRILSQDTIESEKLTINLTGKAQFRSDVKNSYTNINCSNSLITLGGSSTYMNVKSTGAGSVNVIAMDCSIATAETASNAECFITATDQLKLKAITNSHIFYKGEPEVLVKDTATLGEILSL